MATITITRKSLYDQVWSEPILHLATRYGLSNVGLAKICCKHDIPRPPRGHWAKLQFGKASPQTPLPRPDQDSDIAMQEPPPSFKPPAKSARLEKPIEPITVAETLRNAHELVNRAKHQLQNAMTDERSLIVVPTGAALDICVSKGRLHRALLIMDALFKAAEKQGYRVAHGPIIEVEGVSVSFDIKEQLGTLRDEQPEEPDLEAVHYAFGHSQFRKRTVPSGRLVLSIADGPPYWQFKRRRSWSDGIRTLEEYLNRILQSIVAIAEYTAEEQADKRRQEEQRREQEHHCQEVARLREQRRQLFEAERQRVNSLLRQAKNWRKSQILREFIDAGRRQHLALSGTTEPSLEFAQWFAWATQQANRLDPFTKSPPSILDEVTGEEDSSL